MGGATPPSETVRADARKPVRPRFAALRSRNFTILWLGLIVSTAGAQMQQVAKAWLIVQGNTSPLPLAVLGLFYAGPTILLAPLAGSLADRVDRIALLKTTQAFAVIQPLIMAGLLATNHAPLWVLYLDTAVVASINAFASPVQQALLPALVPREDLLNATTLQSLVWTGSQFIGPALGGVLLGPLGAAWVFAINGLSTLAVLAALSSLRGVPPRAMTQPGRPGSHGGALPYIWANRPLLALLALLAAIIVLTGLYQVLLPFSARDIWHVGAEGYGLLLSAAGAGTLLGGFGLAAIGEIRPKALISIAGTLLMSCTLLGLAYAPSYALGLTLLVVFGAIGAVTGSILTTLLQLGVPDAMRGRVMALRYLLSVNMTYVGGLIGGGLAQAIGPTAALVCGGFAVVGIVPVPARQIWSAQREAERSAEHVLPGVIS